LGLLAALASAPFEELERVKVLCSATTMDSIYVLTLALAAIAAVAYILMAARERGAVDSPQVTTILSWVLLVLVSTAVGQALMYDPEEAPMLKILYGMAIVLALANAVVEVVTDEKQKRRDENKIFVWGASGVALLAIVVIALRATAWEQTRKRLAVLREEYVVEPGEDRVAAAEGVIVRQGPGRGVMKRALRILNRAARKRSAARV
jgi:CDP-diglyceride synthetase